MVEWIDKVPIAVMNKVKINVAQHGNKIYDRKKLPLITWVQNSSWVLIVKRVFSTFHLPWPTARKKLVARILSNMIYSNQPILHEKEGGILTFRFFVIILSEKRFLLQIYVTLSQIHSQIIR